MVIKGYYQEDGAVKEAGPRERVQTQENSTNNGSECRGGSSGRERTVVFLKGTNSIASGGTRRLRLLPFRERIPLALVS